MICKIVPDEILEKIEKNSTSQAEKDAARRTLVQGKILKDQRQRLKPLPQPHVQGEDRRIYDGESKTVLPGKKLRGEDDPDLGDSEADEAFHGLGNFYRFLWLEFQRSSVDGKGLPLIATVRHDKGMDNAFYYGDGVAFGSGTYFNPMTRDGTVSVHEIMHWLTELTCKLTYQGASGALNEHGSDWFAACAEQYAYGQTAAQGTWLIGQMICEGKVQSGSDKPGALRNMLNPGLAYDDPTIGKDPQGSDMDHYYKGSDDNGGVHINSGIPNRAFTLASMDVGGFAWEKIGKIWFKVWTEKMGSSTSFQQLANLTYLTAAELFGDKSKEQVAVQGGWDAVKIDATKAPADPLPVPDTSPCLPELSALLSDAAFMAPLVDLLSQDKRVARLLARIHANLK